MTVDARYAANLSLLAQHAPHVLEGLANFPLTNIRLFPNANGQLVGHAWSTREQGWTPLCNVDDPEGEAAVDCQTLYSRDIKVFCLLGLGLGYFAAALARRLEPHQRLIVYDLDPTFYKAALHCVDVADLMLGKRVDLVIGSDILAQVEPLWLSLDVMDKLHLSGPLRSGYTHLVSAPEYDTLMTAVTDMLRFHGVGLSTWRIFGAAIGNNDLLNAPEYFANPGYEQLKDAWQGKPAVCIAAGPSLHKNLRLLMDPAVRQNVVVIAVGTVYELLRSLHIEPDIVTTIDFQRLNWTDQFQHVALDRPPALVYLHSTYPQTPRRWPGPCFVGENASDTVNWLRAYSGGKKAAAQVQTVAHLNLLVALELGCNPIALIGQDLSMPPQEHHAVGALAQDQAPASAGEEAFVQVPDFQGQPVHTRHSFLSMLTVFSRLVREHPGVEIVNCSEAGLAIPGLANRPFQAFLEACPALPAEALWGFRTHLRTLAAQYVPVIDEGLYEAIATLRREVALLIQNSGHVVRFAREMGLEIEGARRWILNHEAPLQQYRTAFGLFCIRHFGLIELMAEVPPAEACVPDQAAKDRYNCERLIRVSQMLLEEAPLVERLLRVTEARLLGLRQSLQQRKAGTPTHLDDILLALTQQRYKDALHALEAWEPAPGAAMNSLRRRLLSKILWHQQRYAALEPCEGSRQAQRLEGLLARHAARRVTALQHYLGRAPAMVAAPSTPPEQFMEVSNALCRLECEHPEGGAGN